MTQLVCASLFLLLYTEEMESIKQIAPLNGTVIIISDLFHEMQGRRQDNENRYKQEYSKIVDVVQKYAIFGSKCAFLLKSDLNKIPDVKTTKNSSMLTNISIFHRNEVAKNLVFVDLQESKYSFEVQGYVSNTISVSKKYVFILFINKRLVDCDVLKKKVLEIYKPPKLMIGYFPFILLSLQISPQNIDVNMHPSKSEVRYLNEDVINDRILKLIEDKLVDNSNCQTLQVNPKLKSAKETSFRPIRQAEEDTAVLQQSSFRSAREVLNNQIAGTKKKTAPWNIVRNDARVKKIKEAFKSAESKMNCHNEADNVEANKLDSVAELRQEFKQDRDDQLKDLLRNSTYVGLVDRFYLQIEHENKLFQLPYKKLW